MDEVGHNFFLFLRNSLEQSKFLQQQLFNKLQQ